MLRKFLMAVAVSVALIAIKTSLKVWAAHQLADAEHIGCELKGGPDQETVIAPGIRAIGYVWVCPADATR